MNMFIKIMVIIACAICSLSCSNQIHEGDNNDKKRTIVFDSTSESISVSKFIERIAYVPLETNEQCVISEINRLEIINNNIYILDNLQSALLVFDSVGSFITKHKRIGKGPSESIKINDFDYCIENKEIVLLINDNTLLFLDEELNVKRKQRIPFRARNLACVNENMIALYTAHFVNFERGSYQLIMFNTKSKRLTGYFNNTNAKLLKINSVKSFDHSNSVIFHYPLDYSFYSILPDQTIIETELNFSNRMIDYSHSVGQSSLESFLEMPNKVFNLFGFYKLDNFLFFSSVINKKTLFNIHSPRLTISTHYLDNDITHVMFGNVVGSFPNGIITELSAVDISFGEKKPTELIKVKPMDNPIICYNYVKETFK